MIRNILNRPSLSKPKLGTPPSYLFEDTPVAFKTTTLLRGFDNQIDRQPARINVLAIDFFSEFLGNLKSFKINYSSPDGSMGKRIYENIIQYTPLRDDYIAFIEKLAKSYLEFDVDVLIRFFESLIKIQTPDEPGISYQNYEFSNFNFITYELFLYGIVIFLKHERYNYLADLFYTKYFNKAKLGYAAESESYTQFNVFITEIKTYYNHIKSVQVLNPTADFLVTRLPINIDTADFVDGDLLGFYIGLLNGDNWFPQIFIYKDRYNITFPFFNRLISIKQFEKAKELLNVLTIEEFKTRLITAISNQSLNPSCYSGTWQEVTPISQLIDPEKIGISK